MTKSQKIMVMASLVIAAIVVSGAFVIAHRKQKTPQTGPISGQQQVTGSQLATADGKNGHDCYVAIDGTVYLIKDFSLWQNGQHLPSQGLAYCGADLSKVIDQAPHGRKILDILPKVGSLVH